MTDVQNDPDRVVHPLRRRPDGEFERVSWEHAIADIGARLRAIIAANGPQSVGWYFGNPGAFSYSHALWVKGFLDALGTSHYYTASSQDVANRFVASALLYGSPTLLPIPDLARTRFLLMFGANPFVSHGSVLTAPKVKEQLHRIVERGGRVVVVDPRRSETARHFEHVAVRPDTDAWLLLSLLCVLVEEGLADEAALARQTEGWATLARDRERVPPEQTEARTGVPAGDVRALARDLAAADCAAVYGRTGSCTGRFGTLVAFLLDLLNAATGNLDRPGGAVFGLPAIALDEVAEQAGLDTYGKTRSRIGGFPDVIGALPAALMAREMTTPGERQIRAFFTSAGNPVLSCPDGDELEQALGDARAAGLDRPLRQRDQQRTPTTSCPHHMARARRHAARVPRPLHDAVRAVRRSGHRAARRGARGVADHRRDLEGDRRRALLAPGAATAGAARLPDHAPAPARHAAAHGPRRRPFGLRRRGLSLKWLRKHPHGVVTAPVIATDVLPKRVRHAGGKVRLEHDALRAGDRAPERRERRRPVVPAAADRPARAAIAQLVDAQRAAADARPARTAAADAPGRRGAARRRGRCLAVLTSKSGELRVPVRVTDEVMPGVVALPHGWGHRGGWRVANAAGGVNVNQLMSSAPEDLEPLAGMAFLNGVPVRVEPVAEHRSRDTPSSSPRSPKRGAQPGRKRPARPTCP